MSKIDKNQKSLQKEIKLACLDWAKTTTFNGLSNFFSTNTKIIKILWFLFIIISLILCLHQIVEQLQDYYKYEVKSKISYVKEYPTAFPVVSICNSNFLNTEFGANFSRSTLESYLNSSNNSAINAYLQNLSVQRYLVQANANILNETTKRKLGLFGDEFKKSVINCIFDGTLCTMSNFEWYYDSTYGNCLKFNSNKTETVNNAEILNSLSMEIFIDDGDELVEFTRTRGLHLIISDNLIQLTTQDSLEITTGLSSNIALTKTKVQRLPRPFSSCRPHNSLNEYSQILCSQNCYQEELFKNCSCYDTRFKVLNQMLLNNTKICIQIQDIICALRFFRDFHSSLKSREKCDLKCPDECYTTKFSYKISTLEFPAERYANFIINDLDLSSNLFRNISMNYTKLKRNVAAFNIYFDDLIATSIDEQPTISENDLKSNIGGAMSLYIGISIVSLCQFMEIFIKLVIICFQLKKTQENNLERI